MRILAWPASITTNNHMDLLYGSMAPFDIEVDDFSSKEMSEGNFSVDGYDVWHIHWPDYHLNTRSPLKAIKGSAEVLSWLKEAKSKGVKLVWTVHNLRPHERYHPYLEPFFYRPYVKLLDGWIALSQTAANEATAKFSHLKDLPSFVIPRGHYRDSHRVHTSKQAARERLGIAPESEVILNFGQIRKYKNVPHLVRAFRALGGENKRLLIAGQPRTSRLQREIEEEAQGDSRVQLHLSFIPDEDVQLYFAAADIVVLPYQDILHSGSALMALSLDKPILVPDMGAMEELQSKVGEAWVRRYDGALNAAVLRQGLAWAREVADQRVNLDALAWDEVGKATWRAFHEILSRAR